jgi:hypothetical protein
VAAQFLRFDRTFVLCSHPPICVLFQRDVIEHEPFPDMKRDCIPVFATTFSVKIRDMCIRRHQVPISPAFALTDYKVQSSTYQNAVLDLHRVSKAGKKEASHTRYCSNYVQPTRLKSLNGLWLLQPVTLDDVNNQMHPQLLDEDRRLQRLAAATMRLEMHSQISDPVQRNT